MVVFPRLSPVPAFPAYSGPYAVGSCDCELPVHDLNSPSETPRPEDPGTVSFRVFYPCTPTPTQRPVRWIPTPQRQYVSAYAKFLGATNTISEVFSLIPQLLLYASIPVHRNAQLLEPTDDGRWPVVIFSHGLGGSRNAYSYILGSLASHGVVVIAPDHRDGSAPISYVRATEKCSARTVHYQKVSHSPSQEVYDARDDQLRTRLWELGLIHDAVLKIDDGHCPKNLDPNSSYRWRKNVNEVLDMFVGRLDVQQPGSIIWAGHSFGAATMVQFVKSTYYQIDQEKAAIENYSPLFKPSKSSEIARQITPRSIVILLDMWCLPLRSQAMRWLWEKPMPCYAANGPGGTALLAVLSEAFYNWSGNLNDTKRTLAPPPTLRAADQPKPRARLFYPSTAAHLSQSDFGILFPFWIKRFLKVDDPERIMRLNTRAILQVLRENGYRVADTSKEDMEDGRGEGEHDQGIGTTNAQDWKILDIRGAVRGWNAIHPDVEKDESNVADQSKPPADQVDETEVLGEIRV